MNTMNWQYSYSWHLIQDGCWVWVHIAGLRVFDVYTSSYSKTSVEACILETSTRKQAAADSQQVEYNDTWMVFGVLLNKHQHIKAPCGKKISSIIKHSRSLLSSLFHCNYRCINDSPSNLIKLSCHHKPAAFPSKFVSCLFNRCLAQWCFGYLLARVLRSHDNRWWKRLHNHAQVGMQCAVRLARKREEGVSTHKS